LSSNARTRVQWKQALKARVIMSIELLYVYSFIYTPH